MARFWMGDPHFGHKLVSELRGFTTTDEHDEVILKQLTHLTQDDEVWILGDLSSGRPEQEDRALDLLRAVPARLHLIAGNHDSVSSIHRNGWKHQRRFLEVFESVQQFGRIRLFGKQILMSHFPYKNQGDGAAREGSRYNEFRLPSEGFPLIHAHTHSTEIHPTVPSIKMSYFDGEELRYLTEPEIDYTQYCVSWEAHRRLVSEKDLNEWGKKLNATLS